MYPAAYPRPGNREKNFLPDGAAAISLKMTEFNSAAFAIFTNFSHGSPVLRASRRHWLSIPLFDCSSAASQLCRPWSMLVNGGPSRVVDTHRMEDGQFGNTGRTCNGVRRWLQTPMFLIHTGSQKSSYVRLLLLPSYHRRHRSWVCMVIVLLRPRFIKIKISRITCLE